MIFLRAIYTTIAKKKRPEVYAMEFIEMKNLILRLQKDDYRNFVKALVSIETDCMDEDKLERIYEKFMEDDAAQLLNFSF